MNALDPDYLVELWAAVSARAEPAKPERLGRGKLTTEEVDD